MTKILFIILLEDYIYKHIHIGNNILIKRTIVYVLCYQRTTELSFQVRTVGSLDLHVFMNGVPINVVAFFNDAFIISPKC